VRQQQLFLVVDDDEHDADAEQQHPRDDEHDADDAQAQVQTGLLRSRRRFIAARRRS
jgi:hypothetical protein